MKRLIPLAVALSILATPGLAQTLTPRPEPTQDPNAPYRLFNTKNVYTFIKLDTRSGQLWQVQWGDKDHRFTDIINSIALVSGGKPGRFTLYPTENVYTFLMLDQETGDTWHVQWGKPDERFVIPIECPPCS